MLIFDKMTAIWQGITFGTKFVLIVSTICCIIDLLVRTDEKNFLFDLFQDVPKKIIDDYQFWRLLVPQFLHGDIYNLFVSLVGFLLVAVEVEKYYGTIPLFCDIFFKNLIIQIIFVLFCWGFSYLDDDILIQNSFGFWNITFIYMMNKALVDTEPQKFLCFPFNVPSKFYPPTFFVLMNLLEYPRIDLVAATIFAIFENIVFDGFMMKLSKGFVIKIEQSFLFRHFQSRQDFITCDQVNHAFGFEEAKKSNFQLEIGSISTNETKIQDQSQSQQ